MVRRLSPLEPHKLLVGLSLVMLVCLPQVLSANAEESRVHTVEKRNVGVLARTGQLPYRQGKRYVASLARSGALPLYVHKKLHPGMTSRNQLPDLDSLEPGEKRYMGSLARAGALPFQYQSKRDAADDAVLDALDARDEQDLEKLKALEAETKALETVLYLESQLNLELLKEKLLDMAPASGDAWSSDAGGDVDEQKRSMASLARGGNLPLQGGADKRSVEALARAGYLPATQRTMAARNDDGEEQEGVGKRGVAALARNGQMLREGKRGGIGSLARNNLLPQKKSEELDELEALIHELASDAEADAEAEDVGKRNLGALAKGGGYARYASGGVDVGKRNLAALARSRGASLREGKRYLGALARSQNLPFHKRDRWFGSEAKRVSPMAISKTWNYNNEGNSVDGIAKRYVAALLRQGRLPVGPEETADSHDAPEATDAADAEDKEVGTAEAKRHISSLKGSPVSKRSVGKDTAGSDAKPAGSRPKREAAYMMPSSDEYPMPNVQNSELFDYDDLMEVMSGAAAPEKRFLGRIPQMGRRPKTQTPPSGGRRRPSLRDDDLY